ncbi:septum site-determining protein MinC [Atopococcus tabaci]|uniref:septum site-determining protein MinC n=1 Tax=Atopococcus tabaci TaxID=269774 RepID=UPI0012EB2A0A|nr:septum site-determining protein MinC [Atopococcus tabaci]
MDKLKQVVSLRGVKDGYQLRIEAEAAFKEILEQLESLLKKINNEQKNEKKDTEDTEDTKDANEERIPLFVETGNRLMTEKEKEKITSIVKSHSQFDIQSFNAEVVTIEKAYDWHEKNSLQLKMDTVRSGQVMDLPGDVLLIGNINPGGVLRAAGSIFIIGELRGIAHAGFEGDEEAVVVADYQHASQVRLADQVHVLEEKETPTANYEVAYINESKNVNFEPVDNLKKIRPALGELTGRLL